MSTILVVDDEQPIRELVGRLLERRGHRVIVCGSAREALAVTEAIDLLLVDLVLPDMNGCDLSEALRRRCPHLPVVLMSGYLSEKALMPPPPSVFLQKPMLPAAVAQAVEGLLNHTLFQSQIPNATS